MKLIYIANARIPTEKAHGINIMKMCESLAGEAEVELIIPRRFNRLKKDPFDYYGVARIFKIKKLFCLDLIPLDKYLNRFALWIESASFVFSVLREALLSRADVFYTRDKFLLLLSVFKKNTVFEIHTFPRHYGFYALFFGRLRKIVVITQGLKNLFVEKGVSPDKILVAPDGVDLEKFDIKESKEACRGKLALSQNKKTILYTGHFYQWKGVDVLLEAARELSDVLFVLVGGTENDIKTFKEKARNLSNVAIIGHKPHQEIPYWLKAADVLCLPNSGKEKISRHWTSPIKMFEYMAAKRPIVASNLPSIREILNAGNAILIEPNSPKALIQGIKRALQNPQLSDKISTKAFQDVQQYTWQERADNILKFLNR